MNQVELKIVINRENAQQRGVRFYREGSGDDMVEGAADYFEKVFTVAMQELLKQSGGSWLGGPRVDPQQPEGGK